MEKYCIAYLFYFLFWSASKSHDCIIYFSFLFCKKSFFVYCEDEIYKWWYYILFGVEEKIMVGLISINSITQFLSY